MLPTDAGGGRESGKGSDAADEGRGQYQGPLVPPRYGPTRSSAQRCMALRVVFYVPRRSSIVCSYAYWGCVPTRSRLHAEPWSYA
eukprot:41900-Rhodomonas_salina.1